MLIIKNLALSHIQLYNKQQFFKIISYMRHFYLIYETIVKYYHL